MNGEITVFNHILGTVTTIPRGWDMRSSVGPYTFVTSALCPDLLRYEQIGEADNLRGRVVRAFFWVMRLWPT